MPMRTGNSGAMRTGNSGAMRTGSGGMASSYVRRPVPTNRNRLSPGRLRQKAMSGGIGR